VCYEVELGDEASDGAVTVVQGCDDCADCCNDDC